jgi:tRNA pseudouridine55 synthase
VSRGGHRTDSASPSGLLLIDKPQGWTSHDVVARTRRYANTRKVGHAGTLDPMATGLLVLGIGSSTRLLTYVVGVDKEYTATIRLGESTSTDDAEGESLSRAPKHAVTGLSEQAVRLAIGELTGQIDQVPSSVSAIKIDGKRAYARVRAGEQVELAARPVTISAFELLGDELVALGDDAGSVARDLAVRVECSSGTYIRALARDLGQALGVGAHLTALRRTRVGPFRIADAAELENIDVAARLLSPANAATALFDLISLTEQQAVDLGHGKRVDAPERAELAGPIAAIAPSGRLVGLVELRNHALRSLVNFPADETGADETGADETGADETGPDLTGAGA